jgi:hypothetical protein
VPVVLFLDVRPAEVGRLAAVHPACSPCGCTFTVQARAPPLAS